MIHAYPSATEAEQSLLLVYGEVTGKTVPVSDLANACWTLLGYGLSIGVPSPIAVGVADPRAHFAAILAPHMIGGGLGGVLLKNIPWGTIVPILIQILSGLLSGGKP